MPLSNWSAKFTPFTYLHNRKSTPFLKTFLIKLKSLCI